uniref:hypothetical protein n=1 Tax=Metabacillus halosaccharovorans TaxID=930124 RepID=UPI003F656643
MLPTTQDLDRMASEINGNIIENLNSTIAFHSNELTTSELIEYFNGKTNVEFADPIIFICKGKLDFLMICYTANNINGTYRSFEQKQDGISQQGSNILLLLL